MNAHVFNFLTFLISPSFNYFLFAKKKLVYVFEYTNICKGYKSIFKCFMQAIKLIFETGLLDTDKVYFVREWGLVSTLSSETLTWPLLDQAFVNVWYPFNSKVFILVAKQFTMHCSFKFLDLWLPTNFDIREFVI